MCKFYDSFVVTGKLKNQLGDLNKIDDLFHVDAPTLADGQYIESDAEND